MIEPDKNLGLCIQNLRSLNTGRIAFAIFFTASLDGQAKARVYNRGVHFFTLTAEGNTVLRLQLEFEVALELSNSNLLTGMAIKPKVVDVTWSSMIST